MMNRTRSLAIWLGVALTLSWSFDCSLCLGGSPCCQDEAPGESKRSCCEERDDADRDDANRDNVGTPERAPARTLCSCETPLPTPVAASVLYAQLAGETEFLPVASVSRWLPRHDAAPQLDLWIPSRARGPPDATGLS